MITRRQFINGMAVSVAGSVVAGGTALTRAATATQSRGLSGAAIRRLTPMEDHPPLRQGLRGSHDGAFEVAHEMALQGRRDWGAPSEPDASTYDLIVVGCGISGLAAAHFYRKSRPDARILLLDNHDDFGGHARRNEFELNGRSYLGSGGSWSLTSPTSSPQVDELFADLDIDLDVFDEAYDHEFYARHGLHQVFYFDRETYGVDRILPGRSPLFFNAPPPETPVTDVIDAMPFSAASKKELHALYALDEDTTPGSIFGEYEFLKRITYEQLITEYCGVRQPEVINWLRAFTTPSGLWGDSMSAAEAVLLRLPGVGGTSFRWLGSEIVNRLARRFLMPIRHFPDGNATIARLLVRSLIPEAMDGEPGMRDVVTTPFDYKKLDRASSPVRIRLNSTVVRVEHEGAPSTAKQVSVGYVRAGQAERVKARHCVLACWNMAIPHIWSEIPETQSEALRSGIKLPQVYSNVLLRRWDSLKRAGVAAAFSPGCYHTHVQVDLPVSLGDYRFAQRPEDPIVLHMMTTPRVGGDPNPRVRARAARYALLGTSFSTIEADVRRQLGGMLGAHGFDPERDIAGLTVNRWSHGWTMAPSSVFDPEFAEGERPYEIGRKPLGRIVIANSDSDATPLVHAAIDQAHRALSELSD